MLFALFEKSKIISLFGGELYISVRGLGVFIAIYVFFLTIAIAIDFFSLKTHFLSQIMYHFQKTLVKSFVFCQKKNYFIANSNYLIIGF